MKITILAALLGLMAGTGALAATEWKSGDKLGAPLCPDSGEGFELGETTDSARSAGADWVLSCRDSKQIYLLKGATGDSDDGKLEVLAKIAAESPQALLFPTESYNRRHVRTITYTMPKALGRSMQVASHLYATQQSPACPGKYEITQVGFRSEYLKNGQRAFTLEPPKPLGICVGAIETKNGQPVGLPLARASLLDQYISRWSEKAPGGRYTFQVLHLGGFQRQGADTIFVVRFDKDTGETKLLAELAGERFFPKRCGTGFLTARYLPDSAKLALYYRNPRLALADYSAGLGKDVTLTEAYDGSSPDVGHTCEGSIPDYETLRGDQPDRAMVEEQTHRVLFLNFNLKERKTILTEATY